MYYKSTAKKRDENIEFSYLSAVGRALNGYWGLESEGFFRDEAEITSAPAQTFGDVKPGDIRYKDQNNDGKIDDNDPRIPGSLGLSAYERHQPHCQVA